MKRYFEVYALQRSGNHAVLNWLFNQFETPVLFFNNSYPGQDPIASMRNPARLQNVVDLRDFWNFESDKYRPQLSAHDVVCVQFEDKTPVRDPRPNIEHNKADFVDVSVTKLMILRDLYNSLASRAKKRTVAKWYIDLWIEYAQMCMNGRITFISFNHWFESSAYRQKMCTDLDVELHNDNTDYVPPVWVGSSFDGRRKRGSEMDVLNRWKLLNESEYSYVKNLIPNEAVELNRMLFGMERPW